MERSGGGQTRGCFSVSEQECGLSEPSGAEGHRGDERLAAKWGVCGGHRNTPRRCGYIPAHMASLEHRDRRIEGLERS